MILLNEPKSNFHTADLFWNVSFYKFPNFKDIHNTNYYIILSFVFSNSFKNDIEVVCNNLTCKYHHCCGRLTIYKVFTCCKWSVLLLRTNKKNEWLISSLIRINIILIKLFKLINAHSVISLTSCISRGRMREPYPEYRT